MTGHFRIEIKTLSKASGQSAAAANRYDDRAGHSDKSDLVLSGNVNMPAWAKPDVSRFWAAADQYERANGLVARRAILSFPNQLPAFDREGYIREWLSLNVPNCPASWAIHDDHDADPRNPHCHILISERMVDGIDRPPELFFRRYNAKDPTKGGCRKADIGSNRKDWLSQSRKTWADILNAHLPMDKQVSHLSNDTRGLPEAQPKFGPKVLAVEAKGIRTRLVSSILEDAATANKIRCLSFVDSSSGKTITYRSGIDKGDSVQIVGKLSRSKVIDLVNACREKGWSEVTLFGTDEFKLTARIELARAGIKIKGENDEQNSTNDSKQSDGSRQRNSEERGTERSRRPSSTGSADESNNRPDKGHERGQPKADRNASDTARTEAAAGREASSLDNLDDHRIVDIRDLSSGYQPTARPTALGLPPSQRGHDLSKDLTYRAVKKQLAAMMGVTEFEIGILNPKTGQMRLIKANAGQILDQVSRLKRENARGNNIYIRPDRTSIHPYVLLDDLNHEQVAELVREGFGFSLLLETSPNNNQVLIKLPQPLRAEDRKQAERALQKRFDSDLGSADGQHLFRLGGFTNRKPKHERDGRFPFVKVKQALQTPELSAQAKEWLSIAPRLVDVPDDQPERVIEKVAVRPEWAGKRGELAESVSRSHQHLQIKYGASYDPSIADFQIAKTLLKQGWSSDSVREGLRDGSPDLHVRKAGHVDDYLDRTLSKVTGRIVAKPLDENSPVPGQCSQSHPQSRPRP